MKSYLCVTEKNISTVVRAESKSSAQAAFDKVVEKMGVRPNTVGKVVSIIPWPEDE